MRSFVSSGTARRVAAGAVVLGVLAGAGALVGHAYGRAEERSHEAEAVVLVHPSEGNPFSPDSGDDLVNLTTEAELVTADAVAVAVARREPGLTPAEAIASVTTSVPVNTQLIRITVTAADPAAATTRAQAFAETYLDYRTTRTTSAVFDRNAHLAEQERAAEADLAARFDRLSGLAPNTPVRSRVEQQIDVLTAQLAQLRTEQTALRSTAAEPGEVITPAAPVGAGLLPATVWAPAAGGSLALLVGVGALTAWGRRKEVVDNPADLEAAEFEVWGTPDRLTDLRGRMLAATAQRPLVCLVAGAGADGPTSPVATDLAQCLARAGWETIHLDLTSAAVFPGAQEAAPAWHAGLVDVLRDRATVDDALVPLGPHLHRLRLGTEIPAEHRPDLLGAAGMGEIVEQLRKRADLVVITGVDLSEPSAEPLLGHVDAVALWVRRRRATLGGLRACAARAEGAGVQTLGVVYDATGPTKRTGPAMRQP